MKPEAQLRYGDVQSHFPPNASSSMDGILAGDVATYLLDDILVKVDPVTMANSLEARAPLSITSVIEFAARLPMSLKLRGDTSKYSVPQGRRTAAAGRMPAEGQAGLRHSAVRPAARSAAADVARCDGVGGIPRARGLFNTQLRRGADR